MHWIWGNGILSVVSLLRETSDVWCTSTVFPVYSWDPSLGEHGQLIENNGGLAHCFAALGEIILLCLIGSLVGLPSHFYVIVATSNVAIVSFFFSSIFFFSFFLFFFSRNFFSSIFFLILSSFFSNLYPPARPSLSLPSSLLRSSPYHSSWS
jgi:hypothetical protein